MVTRLASSTPAYADAPCPKRRSRITRDVFDDARRLDAQAGSSTQNNSRPSRLISARPAPNSMNSKAMSPLRLKPNAPTKAAPSWPSTASAKKPKVPEVRRRSAGSTRSRIRLTSTARVTT